jgi:hypothetical protein
MINGKDIVSSYLVQQGISSIAKLRDANGYSMICRNLTGIKMLGTTVNYVMCEKAVF